MKGGKRLLPRLICGSLAAAVTALAMAAGLAVPAAAQTTASLAQSFNAGSDTASMVAGALVSTKTGSTSQIELASTSNASRLVGVVAKDPLLTITDNNGDTKVVLGGKAVALVSDLNGPLKSGDKITVSPIAGVGMKATADGQVVGSALLAQSDPGLGGKTSSRSITDTQGKSHTVKITVMPIQVGVALYQAPGSNFLPPVIQRFANSVAGRQVSFIRVMTSGVILAASLGGVVAMLYISARQSMTSIGRNPLSATSVYRGLYRVTALALVVLVFGLASSYLLLKV